MSFSTEVYGKCIIAGEHAVLRGCPALVFPLSARRLQLSYEQSEKPLSAHFQGARGDEMRLLFWGVWERALELSGHAHSEVTGTFTLDNTLPVGAGMGASATLCVAVGRWFEWRGWVKTEDVYEFSRQLENLFHGESSGADIAVALQSQPLYFVRGGERRTIQPQWQPQWYVSYSGSRGVTAECISKVKAWIQEDPAEGLATDSLMRESVELCERALALDAEEGLPLLTQAIGKARTCFERWGLTHGDVDHHMRHLSEAGAIAVKPTGSGNGGFILSLWKSTPPAFLSNELIPVKF